MAIRCKAYPERWAVFCVLGSLLVTFYGIYMQLKALQFEDAKLSMLKQGEVTYKNLLLGVYLRLPVVTAINCCVYALVNLVLVYVIQWSENESGFSRVWCR